MNAICYGIIATAAAALVGGVMAQDVSEITVQATRNMSVKTDLHNPPGGATVKDISLSYVVNTAGLNLSLHADVLELERRVKTAALTACREIGHQYPHSTPADVDCAKAASDRAMVTVNTLAAAAGAKSN